MWDNYKLIKIGRDHDLVIPRRGPEAWFSTDPAWLAPLYFKRNISLDKGDRLYAWTLYNEGLGTDGWEINPDDKPNLVFPIEIHSRKPSGHYFIIPPNMRNREWLPKANGKVFVEFGINEMNIWTIAAYNIEAQEE